jgi:thiol-disulfide isomerase/thioredoxin
MKRVVHLLVMTAMLAPAALAQKAGDRVTTDALGKAEWITGSAPAAWEIGKIYILECWATWCGPCIAVIPHIDHLYDKFDEKGLRVIGVNVWEDDKDKVVDFVKTQGEGMSYPVVYVGKGGAFETEWLNSAEVKGIPHAFVVKDGKVLMTTHPSQLTEAVIEGLLAGGEAEAEAIVGVKDAQKKQEEVSKLMQAFHQASANKGIAGMRQAITGLRALDAENRHLGAMEFEVLLAEKEWAGVETSLAKMQDEPMFQMLVSNAANALIDDPDSPAGLRKSVAAQFATVLQASPHPSYLLVLSKLHWSLDEKVEAVAAAIRAAELANSPDSLRTGFPATPYERFAAALKNGEMPLDEEVTGWIREAMPIRPAAKLEPAGE